MYTFWGMAVIEEKVWSIDRVQFEQAGGFMKAQSFEQGPMLNSMLTKGPHEQRPASHDHVLLGPEQGAHSKPSKASQRRFELMSVNHHTWSARLDWPGSSWWGHPLLATGVAAQPPHHSGALTCLSAARSMQIVPANFSP